MSSNLNKLLPDLVATVTLLDDSGSININITTADDYNNVAGKTKFRVPDVANYTAFNQSAGTLKKFLMDFFNVNNQPFYYTIYEEKNSTAVLYQSDP